ncbi:succinate dehydrogenase flavoprotein subunit [Streptomyces laurentii]|uniref:Succinate dehydrogenase flavoprotein subunit n=1 Tax=Streptomyces laurentii TaxID=39478 RepID=A0A160NT46_STRLU|nr:succinate dehydrogenase flavoprotein subunit [Streptomyces laurentii]
MTLVIELRRGVSTARTGRKSGPRPAVGVLERIVVDGELWAALDTLGRHRLPTLADVDPYGDTLVRGEAVDNMVRELEGADLARLRGVESQLVSTLLAWGLRCRADRDLRIAFSGD